MIKTKLKGGLLEVFWNTKHIGIFYKDVDGFYYFTPEGEGSWSDYALRAIANELTKLNKKWTESINKHFAQKENK